MMVDYSTPTSGFVWVICICELDGWMDGVVTMLDGVGLGKIHSTSRYCWELRGDASLGA
jgi:hypothetical protein